MIRTIINILLAGTLLLGLSACTDDPQCGDNPAGEGESVVSFGATFRPLANASLGKTRSVNGDAIRAGSAICSSCGIWRTARWPEAAISPWRTDAVV